MKAVVNDKKHLTLVSHTNGVVIVEESGCIIDLDFQLLASICEIADLGNICTIKDCDEIESLKSDNNELTERIKFLENQLVNNDNRITELRNQINGLNNELNLRGERIAQLNKIIEEKTNKIIEEKTNNLIKLKNIEDTLNATVKVNEGLNTQLSCAKEDIDKLNKRLEEKTSLLAERTHALRVFRQALYNLRLYVQPHKEYKLDSNNSTVLNSISSSFFIRFKDISIASKAINDCRYCISLKDVLDKYENDIVDFNVSAMDIYYIHKASPNVVRKFNYDNFNITCKDQLTANSINTLLNCSNSSVDDIVETFKNEIAYSNIH